MDPALVVGGLLDVVCTELGAISQSGSTDDPNILTITSLTAHFSFRVTLSLDTGNGALRLNWTRIPELARADPLPSSLHPHLVYLPPIPHRQLPLAPPFFGLSSSPPFATHRACCRIDRHRRLCLGH